MEKHQSNKLFLSFLFLSLTIVVGLFLYNTYHDPSKEIPVPKIDVPAVKAKIKNAGLVPVDAKYYKEVK